VGVANGPLSQVNEGGSTGEDGELGTFNTTRIEVVWWPATLLIPFIISTFWLGKRYMLHNMKKRIENGEHPFADV